jgi:DNA-binding beta-propeller fold protein YncE
MIKLVCIFLLVIISCGIIDSDNYEEQFITLHGIDISDDGKTIFVSGRGDGKLHIFNSNDGSRIISMMLSENAMAAGIKYYNNKIYITYQALDQVAIIDLSTNNKDIININYTTRICESYTSVTDCIAGDCDWMEMGQMSHCINKVDVCMGYGDSQCVEKDGCDWTMSMCMESGKIMNMGTNTPHFIAIDKTNRYWFVTTITSGFIGRYNLDTNELIDKIIVGDSPALIVLNEDNRKLYVSRMMPMAGMMTGAISTIIQEIDYADAAEMILSNEFEVSSPAPHGLAINSDGSEIYTTSNTADWLWKINFSSGGITGAVLDEMIGNTPDIETQRLKPIQCLSTGENLLFVTCSAGLWYNPSLGIQDTIPGEVQLWNTATMSIIDTLQLSWKAKPWHIVHSPVQELVFVTLAGDNLYPGSSGVACFSYKNNNLEVEWTSY